MTEQAERSSKKSDRISLRRRVLERGQRILEGGVRGLARTGGVLGEKWRRWRRVPSPVAHGSSLLPTLIKVYAAFTKVDGAVMEEEIDSSLGFLRYDYPDAVYSELRKLFRQALHEHQDLADIARRLAGQLDEERKLLLGIQLYDLISKAGLKQEQVVAYYSFMTELDMASQAIDIVYQLNASAATGQAVYAEGQSPLEVMSFGPAEDCDVFWSGLDPTERLLAYRYHDLILVKNATQRTFMVQGRLLRPGELGRLYSHQQVLFDDQALTHQDLIFYFNAKKNVSSAHVFIEVSDEDEVKLHRTKERECCLEVVFGLKIRVVALQDVDATLRGQELKKGTEITATLEDKIVFQNRSELGLTELRRRARSLGRRFTLRASKSEYLVSNQPALLSEGDILLTPGRGGDVLLRIECDYEHRVGRLEILRADRPIIVRGMPVRQAINLEDGDVIRIDAGQLLRCNFSERLIEEERNIISTLEVRDLVCRFRNGDTALDNLSFSLRRGEMVCVMGASGCGKSTLLRALAGQFSPVQGEILLNNRSLYRNHEDLKQYIAHIPQFDAFDEHLTIEENLSFAAAIRAPHLSGRERARRVDLKLAELGLNERRHHVVGSIQKKILSGGERKRLNIGLDMIGSADVYLFDEPTSGLSSKDSEHVIETIRAMAHNKIILVTIHQPTSKIFQMFQKVILLDKGGRLVFFGTTQEILSYFAEAATQQQFGGGEMHEPGGTSRPEFIFDVLETPLRDLSGDIIYEENNRGQLVPARRFPPEYWRDKYEAWRLARDVRDPGNGQIEFKSGTESTPANPLRSGHLVLRGPEEFGQFRTLMARAFISKLRNEANLAITLIMAPVLALLIGGVLRYSESNSYDFASAFHIPAYLFLAVVVAMFLGLTNSVDDIIRDRPVLERERNLNVRVSYYVLAKALSLAVFAVIQCLLFTWIGNWLLGLRGIGWTMFSYLLLTSMSGIGIGLLISSLVSESKTAILLIPAVFIPQIILGGSFIKYEEMNRNLDLGYSLQQWFLRHPDSAMEPRSDLQVPLISQFNPMRWSYEALVYGQAVRNPLTLRQRQIQRAIRTVVAKKELSGEETVRLDELKELLAILSGLNAASAKEMNRKLREVDRVIDGSPLDRALLLTDEPGLTAEQMFINQKVVDLVSKAEMEQADYRESRHLNVFFGPTKEYFGLRFDLLPFNAGVLIASSLLMYGILYFILRHQLRRFWG